MRMQIQSLALLSGLRIWRCCELWCRLAALALVPYAAGAAQKSKKKKKEEEERKKEMEHQGALNTGYICQYDGDASKDIPDFFFPFFGHTAGLWKFLGQGSNTSSICCLCHGYSNTAPLTHCARPGITLAAPQRQARSLAHCATAGTPRHPRICPVIWH